VRIFNPVVFDIRFLVTLARDGLVLFCDLFRKIDRDVAETLELTRKTATIDEVPRSDQGKLFASRRQNVVIPIDHAHATFGARRDASANRLDVKTVILRDVHDAFAWLDLELDVLGNKFHFHRASVSLKWGSFNRLFE
jgi:hypothetical protein